MMRHLQDDEIIDTGRQPRSEQHSNGLCVLVLGSKVQRRVSKLQRRVQVDQGEYYRFLVFVVTLSLLLLLY
jgi:hypothetical protein